MNLVYFKKINIKASVVLSIVHKEHFPLYEQFRKFEKA